MSRIALILSVLLILAGCTSSKKPSTPKEKPAKTPTVRKTEKAAATGKASTKSSKTLLSDKVSSAHDAEVKKILALAEADQWEEAEIQANALAKSDPQDYSVARMTAWVRQQRQLRRDAALENRIREINAKSSVPSSTLPNVLLENRDRGLPLRQDVQAAVQQIENAPYVPETYNKTNYVKGKLFDLSAPDTRMNKILAKEISVHLDNVTLEAIIFNVGQAEGINFVADKSLPAFKQTLSVNMDKVKLAEFLSYVSRNLEVQFQVGEDLIWIVDAKDPKKIFEETRFFRLRKGFVMQAQFGPSELTRVVTAVPNGPVTTTENQKMDRFVSDGAPAVPSIATAIGSFFKGSKFMIDYERNLIVATGTPEQLKMIEDIIKEFDQPIQQVLIEAKFITVTEGAFLQLGMNWETGEGPPGRTRKDFTGFAAAIAPDTPSAVGTGLGFENTFVFTNVLEKQKLTATLTALEQSGQSQTLSAPRLTLINNLPARIDDGKVQYYFEEYQVKQTLLERATTSSFVPAGKPVKITSGVSLDVVASVGGDGETIVLGMKPEVNQDVKLVTFTTLVEGTNSFEIRLPEYRTQSLATRLLVKSGQTVVMGGVLERQQVTMVEAVPILSRIPIIGAAFRKRTDIDQPRYLLIFVTATLLSESGEFLIYDNTANGTPAK